MSSESDDPKKPSEALPVLPADQEPASTKPEPSPGASGSVDVKLSNPELPPGLSPVPKSEPSPGGSGSVDVKLSNPELGAVPETVSAADSQPVSASGAVVAAIPSEGTGPARRGRRVTNLMQDAVSAGVERLGAGIETVGEGVTKVGDFTKKVPLVGASVGKLGEGLTKAGESIHALPRVAQTRRGRLLVRSVVVGFLLVFSWITVIVGFQLREHDTPDFRPAAEQILLQINKGRDSIGEVYDHASPRFQELVGRDKFIENMMDLNKTNGRFLEITAVNETLVTTGPTGRVGRVSLTAAYERGIAHGSISFHYHKGQWKLLGIGIEVPRNVPITEADRERRVAACPDPKTGKDVSDQRTKCEVRDALETILEKIRDNKAGEVWDEASDIFKEQGGETRAKARARFIQVQDDTRAAIGNYKRLLTVTEAKSISGTVNDNGTWTPMITATFDAVAEFERSSGVRVVADFARQSKTDKWQLRRFKVEVPMPRVEDATSLVPPPPEMPEAPGEGSAHAAVQTR